MVSLFVFILCISAQDAPDMFPEVTSATPSTETIQEIPSPFFACGIKKNSAGQPQTAWYDSSIPKEDRSGIKTKDFFGALQQKIEEKVQANYDLSQQITSCFKPIVTQAADTPDCRELRNWFDPKKYPANPSLPFEQSLTYHIKYARANLALATSKASFTTAMQPNKSLNPYGYKSIPWQPLTEDEIKNANIILNRYKNNFCSTTFDERTKKPLTEQGFNALLQPYDRASEGQIYANPMNVSSGEMRHNVLQDNLEKQFTTFRIYHLDKYRETVAQYPIINYLSSDNPSALELQTAGLRMQDNAKNELNDIKNAKRILSSLEQKHVHPRQAAPTLDNPTLTNLMDYRAVVEELLGEHPEYCSIATAIDSQRQKRELIGNLLLSAPVLAASFLAPPLVALTVTGAAGVVTALNARYQLNRAIQGAYTSPIYNDQRTDVKDVDKAQDEYKKDILMVPTNAMTGATFRGAKKLLPKLKYPYKK